MHHKEAPDPLKNMRQRQEAERHIFFADRQPFIMQVELRRQVAVVQHHPFRLAGSARGIDQGEEILQVALFNTLLTLSDKSRRIGSALEGAQMLCDLAAAQIGPLVEDDNMAQLRADAAQRDGGVVAPARRRTVYGCRRRW